MAAKTVATQLQMLERMAGTPALTRRIQWCAVALCLGAVGMALATWHSFWIMGTVLLGLITMSAFRSTPPLRHAARGAREGTRHPGIVSIRIEHWSDSDTYHATVVDHLGHGWTFPFIPQDWTPKAGNTPAQLVFLPEFPWPVLVIGPEGIMVPRETATRHDLERPRHQRPAGERL
ncbi:MAG: hypothetical protein LDL30_06210 [Desulfovibrio sp.]|nr:hypothetical protein [Desulfovibrio sp.]MCA1985417.1 hypothetical protein [Desulfovibrio sp.]